MFPLTVGLEDLSLTEGGKSRKSSGFSETTKSRNCSGMEDGKSRNCSGNSISQGLISSGTNHKLIKPHEKVHTMNNEINFQGFLVLHQLTQLIFLVVQTVSLLT